MKKTITLLILLLSLIITAQQRNAGSLTIISDSGVNFKLFLNGELQNRIATARVRAENLTLKSYTAKIQFQNSLLPIIVENNIVVGSGNVYSGIEYYNVTYKITVDRRNKVSLVYVDKQPVNQLPIVSPGIVVGNGGRPPTGGIRPPAGGGRPPVGIRPPTGGTRPPQGCAGNWEASQADFQNMKNSVNMESFSSDKIKLLKRLIPSNCYSTAQITEIMKTYFTFDSERLDFAKLALDYCTDPHNYHLLNPLFSFSSSKDKLYEYVDSKKW